MTEPTYPCAKCGQLFPSSQIHQHFMSCLGRPAPNTPFQAPSPFPQQYTPPQPFTYQNQTYVPKHKHIWAFENDTYKVCVDPSCKQIKVKLRGSWQIFLRYGLKLFWIQMAGALALAFYIASVTGVHH